MRILRLSTSTMAWVILTILLCAYTASAVNSLCSTGPTVEANHNRHVAGIDKANDELNDYYRTGNHMVFLDGIDNVEHVMFFQRWQPQNYIVHVHGNSQVLRVGEFNDRDDLGPFDWGQNVWAGGHFDLAHSPAPFSAVMLAVPDGADDLAGPEFQDGFFNWWNCWVYITPSNNPGDRCLASFTGRYADRITDGGQSYRTATTNAMWWARIATFHNPQMVIVERQWGALGHPSANDEYRNIQRISDWEGTNLIAGGQSRSVEYTSGIGRNTNGAYVVFHGVIDGVLTDTDTGTIELTIDRWENGWVNYFTTNYEIQNRRMQDVGGDNEVAFGGSDVCSQYVPWLFMRLTSGRDLRATVSFTSNNANHILFDRFEWMEIAS